MNTLTDRQQATLAQGLRAFERASRRRRLYRTVGQGALTGALVLAGGIVLYRVALTQPAGLPASVELVRDDRQLAAELELANACERFSRSSGRLVVVECMLP